MRFQKFSNRYLVRLESGEPVVTSLREFLRSAVVPFSQVTGVGEVSAVRLGYWNAARHAYDEAAFIEQLEVVSFQGNAAMKGGDPVLHIHGIFGRSDFSLIGGQVVEAWVNPTFEVWLYTEGIGVMRRHDAATGLDLLDLPLAVRQSELEWPPEMLH